ncbi:MAG: hypothetical protein ACOH2K_09700 [Burkholderiaceae bacterium]
MTWLAENWIWVLFGVAFVAMHLFGHGGHGGGHGSCGGGHGTPKKLPTEPTEGSHPTTATDKTDSHRH